MSHPSRLVLRNPFTEQAFGEIAVLQAGEVDSVVSTAVHAFRSWRRTPVSERVAACGRFLDAFLANRDAIARDITLQMGKPLQQSLNEVNAMADRTRYMMSIAEETLADDVLPETANFNRFIRHEPLGVVLDIAAWNYPLLIAVNVVVPAVLAGNAVIVKHSSKTPLCGDAFANAFEHAEAPSGLVQAVAASHEVTAALINHPAVSYVSFTGSVRGGKEVRAAASGRFIGTTLELGGKDPAYVCADAPFDFTVENTVDGAFYNAGQSCCAIERIYVDQSIYDRFVEAYSEGVKRYRLGDPMDSETNLGPLASETAPDFVRGQVDEAVQKGAKRTVAESDFEIPNQGWFAAPQVVCDATHDMDIMMEESFGPVIAIAPVKSEEEAVALMNDSPYGLTASIWTSDEDRAVRIGAQIETGTFFMNRCDYLDPALPWTGVKDTGMGASLSKYGLLNLTRLKSMNLRTAGY